MYLVTYEVSHLNYETYSYAIVSDLKELPEKILYSLGEGFGDLDEEDFEYRVRILDLYKISKEEFDRRELISSCRAIIKKQNEEWAIQMEEQRLRQEKREFERLKKKFKT